MLQKYLKYNGLNRIGFLFSKNVSVKRCSFVPYFCIPFYSTVYTVRKTQLSEVQRYP